MRYKNYTRVPAGKLLKNVEDRHGIDMNINPREAGKIPAGVLRPILGSDQCDSV